MTGLNTSTPIRLTNGKKCKIIKEIGRGGQGIVYLVDYEGQQYAFKWYTIKYGTTFYENLMNNINSGSPASNFIWPIAFTEIIDNGNGYKNFGYLMKLRPEGYFELYDFIYNRKSFSSLTAKLNACINVCDAFQRLHLKGLSYQDMNPGNFFIKPDNGDILICDNDNVAPDGTDMGMRGICGYMAPEIIERERTPDRYSDYFSLAVCLFIILYMNNPFEGLRHVQCPCDNASDSIKKLYGYGTTFIMDPTDASNRPVVGIHNNVLKLWKVYPSYLNLAFCEAFSKDRILHREKRYIDRHLKDIMINTRSNIIKCPNCSTNVLYDKNLQCPCCNSHFPSLNILKIGRFEIPIIEGNSIYVCQVTETTDYNTKIGTVISKTHQGKHEYGIINKSNRTWTLIAPDGTSQEIQPGVSFYPVRKGFTIKFSQTCNGKII